MASTGEREDTLTVGPAACAPRGGAGAARAAHLSWSSFRLGAAGRGAPRQRRRRRDSQPHRDAASTRSPAEEAGTAPAPPRPLPRGPMGPAPAAPPHGPAPSAPPLRISGARGSGTRDTPGSPAPRPTCAGRRSRAHGLPRPRPPAAGLRLLGPTAAAGHQLPGTRPSRRPFLLPATASAPHPSWSCCTPLHGSFLGQRLGGALTTSLTRPLLSLCASTSLHPCERRFLLSGGRGKGTRPRAGEPGSLSLCDLGEVISSPLPTSRVQ